MPNEQKPIPRTRQKRVLIREMKKMAVEVEIPVENTGKTEKNCESGIPANSRKNRIINKKTGKYLKTAMSMRVIEYMRVCDCQAYRYYIGNRVEILWKMWLSPFLAFLRVSGIELNRSVSDNQPLSSLVTNNAEQSVNYKGQTFYATGYSITA